jgi:hypothetical protein
LTIEKLERVGVHISPPVIFEQIGGACRKRPSCRRRLTGRNPIGLLRLRCVVDQDGDRIFSRFKHNFPRMEFEWKGDALERTIIGLYDDYHANIMGWSRGKNMACLRE